MHEDRADEVVFSSPGHSDWYHCPAEKAEEHLQGVADKIGVPIELIKVTPRPICRCCGTALPRPAIDEPHKRCRKHQMANPCAIAGCSRTRLAKNGHLHDGTWWLCRDHWRMVCPPHSKLRRAYNRFFQIAKRMGVSPNGIWPEALERRYWRFWIGLVARARKQVAGDIDMVEINKMFGWEE
jgi:hypothetical protein